MPELAAVAVAPLEPEVILVLAPAPVAVYIN